MNEVEIPLKITGIGAIKAELRELKGAIADATDPEQIAQLAAKAGELKDQLADANDAVNVFASGSKFEQVSNSLGGIKDSLMSLDFEEAQQKAEVFKNVIGKINPGDISKGFKAFTGVIQTMGGAFVKLGMQILANPIFLLVAVIVAIVAAIAIFLNKIGVLDKVLKLLMLPITAIIEGFKMLTDWMGLTDNAAEENAEAVKAASESNIKAIEAEMSARKGLYNVTKDLSNEEISAIEEQLGVSIDRFATMEELAIEEEQRKQEQRQNDIAAMEELDEMDEEQTKRYLQLKDDEAKAINRINELAIQQARNRKKLAEDIDKQLAMLSAKQIKNEAERSKAILDIQEKEAIAKLQAQRREAARLDDFETVAKIDKLILLTQQDFQRQRLEITNKGNTAVSKVTTTSTTNTNKEVESAQDKHLKEMRIKHKKAEDDARAAGATEFELAQLKINQLKEERTEIENLNLKKTKIFKSELERGAAVSDMTAKIVEAEKKLEQDRQQIADQNAVARIKTMLLEEQDATKKLELQKTLIEEERKIKVADKKLTDEQIKEINAQAVVDTKAVADQITAIEVDKNQKILAAAQLVAETKLSKEAFELERFKGTKEEEIAANEAFLKTTLDTLKTQKETELAALNLSEEEKAAIEEKFRQAKEVAEEATAAKLVEIDQKAREKLNANIEAGFQLATTAAGAIASIQDINTKKKLKGVQQGSKEEEKILKQQFEQQKKMQLAMAVINGAQAIVSILAQYPKFDGGFAMAAAIAGSVISTATSLATIASTSFEGGGNAPTADTNSFTGGGSTTGGMATPSVSLFGQGNQLNNVGGEGVQQGQTITVNAIVSETEMTDTQNKINKIQKNAEL
jgi:hypothetical protein